MALQLKIEQYEGPLDLLLTLITKHKLDIFDIPIAYICDCYTEYLDSMRELNMDIATDFISMAAELMLIKSRLLLPREEAEEDPRTQLVDALLEHQRAKQAALFLKDRSVIYYDRFIKQPDELELPYSRDHSIELLSEAFRRVAERMKAKPMANDELFVKMTTERWYSVEEKTIFVLRKLYGKDRLLFDNFFTGLHTKNELCALFIALLEMIRAARVKIIKDIDGEIYLSLSAVHYPSGIYIPEEQEEAVNV